MEKVIIRPIEEKDNKEIAALIRKVFDGNQYQSEYENGRDVLHGQRVTY